MAAKTAEHVASVSIRGTLAGKLVETGLFYLFDAAIDDTALAALAASISTHVISDMLPQLSPDWVGREVYAYDMSPGSTLQVFDETIAGETGAIGGVAQPNNVTLAVARKTGLRGRSTQGRVFWPGISSVALASPNEVNTTFAADVVAALQAIDAAAGALGWDAVTLSFQRDHVVTTAAVISLIADWLVTDRRVDTRRRRVRGTTE